MDHFRDDLYGKVFPKEAYILRGWLIVNSPEIVEVKNSDDDYMPSPPSMMFILQ